MPHSRLDSTALSGPNTGPDYRPSYGFGSVGVFGLVAAVLAGQLIAASSAAAQDAATAHGSIAHGAVNDYVLVLRAKQTRLDLVERSSRLVEAPDSIDTVVGFDPAVLTVEAVTDRQVRIIAIAPGVTTLDFIDLNGVRRELEVFVKGDTRHLSAYLRTLFPTANIQATQVGETGESVVLRGWVANPSEINDIMNIAQELYPTVLNQMHVATTDTVNLEVRVLEVNRSKIREFGFDFFNLGNTVRFGSSTAALNPLEVSQQFGGLGTLQQTLAAPNLAIQIINPGYQFFGFLQALENESLAKILADQYLTVSSGRPATLLSGGEFPIIVPQGIGTTSVEFREFGVRLEAIAIVKGHGRVQLDLAPEVSERDFSSSVNFGGVQVPGLTTRRVNTSAEVAFGETLMLGGLVSKRDVGFTRKVPFLGELPYIGMAFSRKQSTQSETELLIMVTPHPAGAVRGELLPPGPGLNSTFPTDKELYVDGLLELPNYGDACSMDPTFSCTKAGGCGTGACSDGSCNSCQSSVHSWATESAAYPAMPYPPTAMPMSTPRPAAVSYPDIAPMPSSDPRVNPYEPYEPYSPGAEVETIDRLTPTPAGQPMPSGQPVPMQMDFDSPGTTESIPVAPNEVTKSGRLRLFKRGQKSPQVMQTSAETPAKPERSRPGRLSFLKSEY